MLRGFRGVPALMTTLSRTVSFALAGALAGAAAVVAQTPGEGITPSPLACLPLDGNGVLNAAVAPETPGSTVRMFFRRLNLEVEDFYYAEMEPAGAGQYWGVFPIPTEDKIQRKDLRQRDVPPPLEPWASWWKAKEGSDHRDPNRDLDEKVIRERAPIGKREQRAWMGKMSEADFQRWLERQQYEPAEYFVAVYDAQGRRTAVSDMHVVEVKKDCRVSLTPQQEGMAKNLTVGETNTWQKGEQPFHWECTGIVTRKDPQLVLRADEACRACVIAWWPYAAGGAAALGAIIAVNEDRPEDVSPARP